METFTTFRTIKREIKFTNSEYDTMVKKYLLENMWYRRKIYNMGVEYIHRLEEYNDNVEKKKYKYFNRFDYDTEFYNTYEKDGKPLHDEFENKVKGIRTMVSRDLEVAIKRIWKERKTTNIQANLHFKKYNPNHQSFGFVNKTKIMRNTCLIQIYNSGFNIRIHCNKSLKINLTLKESFYSDKKYNFTEMDVKEIHFLYDTGKWFILLPTKVTMKKYKDKTRKKLAGIDEGERNSVALHDSDNTVMINVLDNKTIHKLKSIQKRIEKIQHCMDKKVYGSNNYNKINFRYNKLYRRMFNIAHDRRKKLACMISLMYKNVIVDEFNVPIITKYNKDSEDNKGISKKARKVINKAMFLNGMGYFKDDLITACVSYNTDYYKALPYTTRTCSKCGHINEKLLLKKKYLTCNKCGTRIHRDINAAINCYNQWNEIDKYYTINIGEYSFIRLID